jgi:hypothetical protein
MHHSVSGLLLFHLTLLTARHRERDERGDVPGWVMVTLMTAMVIAAILPFVRTQLTDLLQQAFDMVKSG